MTWRDVVTGAGTLLAPTAGALAYAAGLGLAGAICSALAVAGVAWWAGRHGIDV